MDTTTQTPISHAASSSFSTVLRAAMVAIFAAPLVLQLCQRIATRRNLRKSSRLPPGPTTLPVLGNAHQMLWNKPVFRWIHLLMKEMNTDITCLRFGNVHVIIVTCPEIAREFLRKHDAVFASRPASFAARTFSGGYKTTVLSPFGDQWKKMRRVIVSEILRPDRLHRLRDVRAEEADHLIAHVYSQHNQSNGIINIRFVARHFCGNMIRRLTFGKRFFGEPTLDGSPGRDEVEHVRALFDMLDYLFAFCISDYFPQLVGLDIDGHEKVIKVASSILRGLHDPVIDERIMQWRGRDGDGKTIEKKKELQDFLDVLITLEDAAGQPLLAPEEIKPQTVELMAATVDNPSNAVEWALAEMINNPEILQKAIDEIDTVVGKETLVQETDIHKLNYLKACIRESFRLHPFNAFNPPHVAMADTSISSYFIPKGSHVILSRAGLGRNPKVWDDPHTFRPERHLNGNAGAFAEVVLTDHDFRLIPFSTGRRGCPGASLGTSITMMLFARLLQGFTWSKPPGVARIELNESANFLSLAEPLILQAEPRLPLHLYTAK